MKQHSAIPDRDRPPGACDSSLWPERATLVALAALLLVPLGAWELRSSALQAHYLAGYARELGYAVHAGASPANRYPQAGPFDERLGYTRIPDFIERLQVRGYAVTAQARQSPRLVRFMDRGFFAPYREKTQGGLSLLDCRAQPLYATRHPQHVYPRFEDVPPRVAHTLGFIENRQVLATTDPKHNPALEWTRLSRAVLDQVMNVVDDERPAAGGSTLATQLEKYRHSPEGRTASVVEKVRQVVSASVRAYLDGERTLEARQRIVLDYLNSVPLGALPGHGEVIGLGDGLRVWYGADFDAVNRLLHQPVARGAQLAAQARAYRQVLSLVIAQRRPALYLGGASAQLAALTDSHLRLLGEAGVIEPALRDAALNTRLVLRTGSAAAPGTAQVSDRKAAHLLRVQLAAMLGTPRLYDLDRLDLNAHSGIDGQLQQAVTELLHRLREPREARAAGLVGQYLLQRGDPAGLLYSFTLYERGEGVNHVRVQTDNLDQPFDINAGAKLELGSTAKLRTLVTYLEIVAALHARLEPLGPQALAQLKVARKDRIARWAVDHLATARDRSLPAMLEAALERRYSASPDETFFTGRGAHRFENFDPKENGRVPTVREALQDSVNLVFIRLMRDIVWHHMHGEPGALAGVLDDARHPMRAELLARFADSEGRQFMRGFYRKHQRQAAQQAPAGRGSIARQHPLDRWVADYLGQHPDTSLAQVLEAGAAARQQAYAWLFNTRAKAAQDTRIRSVLEADAFEHIHRAWQRVGYPFDSLVPSYATAIGSSGDRPAALAELMGIILNDGVRQPTVYLDGLHFAAATPYETLLGRHPGAAERVFAPEVAAALKRVLAGVVEHGTARRLQGALDAKLPVGGKTGTGDNRLHTYGRGGALLGSRVINRTATFVFFLGERHFGTMTAYVPGTAAAGYRFTSALPVQIVKTMAPLLQPALGAQAKRCRPSLNATSAPAPSSNGARSG